MSTVIHISQLESTTVVDTKKLKDGGLGQLLENLTIEAAVRNMTKQEQIDNTKKEEIEFLKKCRNLIQTVISGPLKANTDKPLKKAYHLFESMVSTLQSHLQNTKKDQIEKTSRLLRQ